MKIIQINTSSPSTWTEDYEKEIYRSWYAQVAFELKKFNKNLDIECWTIEKKYKKEKKRNINGIKFRVFPTNLSLRHGMEISSEMVKALKKEQERTKEKIIIHFHEYHCWQTYLMLKTADKLKMKIIAQHHGARPPLENLKTSFKAWAGLPIFILMQFMENLFLRKVDIFYALSEKEINYLKRITENSKIRFQTMGITEEYFKIINKKFSRKALNLDSNKKYGLYLGRIKTTKGIKELLNAMKEIDSKNLELLFIGEGADYKKYKDYAKNNKINNAHFFGPKYGKDKLLYLSACDFLILPSYTEGAPVVLMEAIAKNLPVIATDVGGIPKMIVNGREGIIIPLKSKEEIIQAIKMIITWKNKDIKKYAEKYKWKEIIDSILDDYEK